VKQDLRLVCRASPTAKITSVRTINSDRLPSHLHHLLQKELQLGPDVRQDLKLARRAYLTALSFIIKDRQGLISSLEAAAPNGGNYSSTSHRSGSPIIIVNIFLHCELQCVKTHSVGILQHTEMAYCNTQSWHTAAHSGDVHQGSDCSISIWGGSVSLSGSTSMLYQACMTRCSILHSNPRIGSAACLPSFSLHVACLMPWLGQMHIYHWVVQCGDALITHCLLGGILAFGTAKGHRFGLRSALEHLCDCLQTATASRSTSSHLTAAVKVDRLHQAEACRIAKIASRASHSHISHMSAILSSKTLPTQKEDTSQPKQSRSQEKRTKEMRLPKQVCMRCRFLKSLDAADKLHHNMQQQHSCLLQFTMTVALRLADKFQGAILIVQSFPWSPDVLSIVDVVAAEDGELSTGIAHNPAVFAWTQNAALLPSCYDRWNGLHCTTLTVQLVH